MKPRRTRLDQILLERGDATSRNQAQALILAGRVRSGGSVLDKPGVRYDPQIALDITPGRRFVGRGGYKLHGALQRLSPSITEGPALDVGASTGGFTQVLLEHGFEPVIALDVGRGQLDWTLRSDPRVIVSEGVNARYLEPGLLPVAPGFAVIDVSFISLRLVLPAVVDCLAPGGEIVTLVKPQFEAGRHQVARGGIVRDRSVHRRVLQDLTGFAQGNGWGVAGVCASSLAGADGNLEFFLHLLPRRPGLAPAELDPVLHAALAEPETGL